MSATQWRTANTFRYEPVPGTTTGRWSLVSDGALLFLILVGIIVYWTALGPDQDASGPVRDASAYAYVGRVVAAGGVPYLDAWDSKGPILYLMHAVSAFAGAAAMQLYMFMLAALLLAGALCLHLEVSRLTSRSASLVSLGVGLAALSWLSHFALAEPLAVAFLFAAVAAFLAYQRAPRPWLACAIGVCAGVVALIRVDLVALPGILGLALLISTPGRTKLRVAALLAGGALAVLAPFGAWIWGHNAFGAMLDQYLIYNGHHSDRAAGTRLLSAASLVMTLILDTGLGVLAVAGWILAVWQAYLLFRGHDASAGVYEFPRSKEGSRQGLGVLATVIVAFVVDVALTFTSGRAYDHYLVRLVPLAVVLSAGALQALWRGAGYGKASGSAIAIAALAGLLWLSAFGSHVRVLLRGPNVPVQTALVGYIKENLKPSDTIFVYGADGWVYNEAGVFAPTKYFYTYPLVTKDYTSADMVDSFSRDLEAGPPAMIVDMPNPRLTPLHLEQRSSGLEEGYLLDTAVLGSFRQWVRANYKPSATFEVPDGSATVWRLRGQES